MEKKTELQIFREYLQKRRLRYTQEREQIIKEIFATHEHFDVDTMYLNMRQKGIRISKASIYRLLPLLIEAELIQEVFFDNGHMYYEHIYGHKHHSHLRCIDCRRIEEFIDPRLKEIEMDMERRFNFKILEHRLEIRGLCPECRENFQRRR